MRIGHRIIRRAVLVISLLGAGSAALAEDPGRDPAAADGADPVAGLRHYFEAVDTLAGAFRQVTRAEDGSIVEEASGRFVMARPQRFVWDYREPWEQLIVSDGEQLWVHDVALEQVVVRPLDEALGVGAAQLLSGDLSRLEEDFMLSAGGEGVVILRPTDPAWDFQRVRLELEAGVPVSITVEDGLGQRVEVVLLDLAMNPEVSPERFEFQPPAGADVMQGS